MRERISHSSGVPGNIETTVSEYISKSDESEGEENSKAYIKNLDLSLLDNYEDRLHYFVEDFDEHQQKYINENKEDKEDDPIGSNVFDLIIKKADEQDPIRFETDKNAYIRISDCKK